MMIKTIKGRLESLSFVTLAAFLPLTCLAQAAETDPRFGAVSCKLEKSGQQVECDYRHAAIVDVKEVSLKIGDQLTQIPANGLSNYPSATDSTALLFLVDVSDPRRRGTVEKKNPEAMLEMLTGLRTHQKVGLAVFDSDFRLLSPIGAEENTLRTAVTSIKASGQATEFYKSILAAIELLQKTDATRKGLILMSDGKNEDRAYKHEDVITAAKSAGVVILGLGYMEKPSDSPHLQTLKRLADETFGLYFDATDQKIPQPLVGKPFSFVEKGGRITFGVGSSIGKQVVSVKLGLNDGKPVELTTVVEFPDTRTKTQRIGDFGRKYWVYLLSGLVLLFVVTTLVVAYVRKRRVAAPIVIEYAALDEMDGSGTRHSLTQTAVRIGRSADNDVHLANNSISLHHAEIHRRREGGFYIVDLASSNGVYVNDAKISQIELHDGDLIELGEVRLRFSVKKIELLKGEGNRV